MRNGANARWALAAMLVLVVSTACSKRQTAQTGDSKGAKTDSLLARVGDRSIHQSDLDDILSNMNQQQRAQYSGVRGRIRLLDQLVNRNVVVKAAEDAGLEKDALIRKQMDAFRTNLLVQAYQRKMVESLPQPTEEQIRKYYDDHPLEFNIQARVNASWIKCKTKAECERARKRIVDAKERFNEVAREVSIDKCSATDGGLLGYFNPIGYVRCLDSQRGPEFAKHAFELEANDVGPVFQWEDGWGFIKVHEKTTERAEPFERVRDRIVARLRPTFSDSLLEAEVAKLRGKVKVEIFVDLDKELAGKSAEDLMKLATESGDPHDKIEYYRALLRKYPHYERADEAQFMIGFVYSEDLQDFESAKREYEKVLSDYSGSKLQDSATYMLQNMGHGHMPEFEDVPKPGAASGNE